MNVDALQRIKRLTISALVADDLLMGILVLKGGNALDIAYNITSRGSIDIDFSMEKDFTEEEKKRLLNQMTSLLITEFSKEDLVVFDIKLHERPRIVHDSVKDFWGGYLLEFKVISKSDHDKLPNLDAIRRNAIPLHADSSSKFTVDISKYEYVANKRALDLEGATVYVYTPEMLALEKIRALCQQIPEYKDIILSMSSTSRSRDFYDIYNLVETFNLDLTSSENRELCKNIFLAKHVPLTFINLLRDQREFHRASWESVINTVSNKESLKDFDFYFDYVLNIAEKINS